jgi:preprotein translocase subunit SecG
MQTLIIIAYLLVSFAIIGLIMLQQGKGADAGASFGGGSSQTVFGSQGGGNFFSKVTGWLAAVFFVLAFGLTYLAKQNSVVDDFVPSLINDSASTLEESDIPTLDSDDNALDSDVPSFEDIPSFEESAPADDVPVLEQPESDSDN